MLRRLRQPHPPRPSRALISLALLLCADVAVAAPKCTVSIGADVLFGSYDVFTPTPLDAIGRIRLQCPKGQLVQVTISGGNSGSCASRNMAGPSDSLCYDIFLDGDHLLVWGDGTNGTTVFSTNAGAQQIQMFGRIEPGQNVGPGSYSDTVVVTVFL